MKTDVFLKGGLLTWLLFGLVVGLTFWLLGLVGGLINAGLLGGLIGLVGGLLNGLLGMVIALFWGFFLWPIGGAISEFVERSPNTLLEKYMVIRPKQGIHRSRQKGILVGLASGLVCGPVHGLLIGVSTGFAVEQIGSRLAVLQGAGLVVGLVTGLVVALLTGLANGLFMARTYHVETTLKPLQVLVRLWRGMVQGLVTNEVLRRGVLISLVVSLAAGLLLLFFWQYYAQFATFDPRNMLAWLVSLLLTVLYMGLFFAWVFGLVRGIMRGLSSNMLDTQEIIRPNQGMRRSIRNGTAVGLVNWLVSALVFTFLGALIFGLPVGLFNTLVRHLPNGLLFGLLAGVNLGLFVGQCIGLVAGLENGLFYGGSAFIQHRVLRFLLWSFGYIPWGYVGFLDYAAEHILLRKVGGGYIFIHRLLLDYFASVETRSPEEASTVSAISDSLPAISSAPQIDTAHREEKASPPGPSRKTGFNKKDRVLALFAAVILLGVSIFSFCAMVSSSIQNYVQKVNDVIATDRVEATTTAEALANASPITYPPQNASPILNDPLQDNSKGNNWEDTSNSNCKFTHRAFDVNANASQLQWCIARTTDFTNFIYEVQMKIVKGDGGGIAFRIDPTNDYRYYYFTISQDGSYNVYAFTDGHDTLLAHGFSSAIHQGLNQTNLVAAVVHGKVIELYINLKRVAFVGNSIYTHGRIGVIATGFNFLASNIPGVAGQFVGSQTEVIFQNAKVWEL